MPDIPQADVDLPFGPYDLISLGEVMLRMAPPKYERLRRTRRLDVEVAGAQLNVAANLARLGKRTAFLSRLPDNELGQLARDTCMSYGVDMAHVPMVPGTRMGVNYLEFTGTPRVGVTIFDRANSAASTMTAADFDWATLVSATRLVYTDGIMPGLSAGCREAATALLTEARRQGTTTCFDVNYREHIWGTEDRARECWSKLLPLVDILVTSRSVSEGVFGWGGAQESDEDIARHYHDTFGCRWVCVTSREMIGVLRGAWNSLACVNGHIVHGRRYEYDVIDRFGTGDAYLAGLLYGYLDTDPNGAQPEYALNFGNAACAMAHTIEGDVLQMSASEVRAIVEGEINLRVKR